jgi:uncharacterized membrane protein
MRLRSILLILALLIPAIAVQAADQPPVKGLFLLTEYPSQTIKAGETSNIRFKLQNAALPPEAVQLSVEGAPADWKATLLGGGQPVSAAMPGTNESVSLQLRLEVPAGAKVTDQKVVIRAKGTTLNSELPLSISVGDESPAKLTLKSRLPALRGGPKSSFEYTLSVTNDSGRDLTVRLAANAPPNFKTTFTEGYGAQEINQLPIEGGQSKEIKVRVEPPSDVKANDYPVQVRVQAENASAQAAVLLQITGQPRLRLVGRDGRLSGEAKAGTDSLVTLLLINEGTAPAEQLEFSGSGPQNWKIEFEPKTLAALPAGERKEVQARLTPPDKTIAGDYMTAFRVGGRGENASADFRITVSTSTYWGIAGIGIIVGALMILIGAVVLFGRR